jgi:hypothetical protein
MATVPSPTVLPEPPSPGANLAARRRPGRLAITEAVTQVLCSDRADLCKPAKMVAIDVNEHDAMAYRYVRIGDK